MPTWRGLFSLIHCIAVLVFLTSVSFSQNSTQQSSSPTTEQGQPAAAPDVDEDSDSADIPPFARGHISEKDYFALRDEEIRTRRGIDDLVRSPQARSQAIRKQQFQEQFQRLLPQGLN